VPVLRDLFSEAYDARTKSMDRKKLGALVFANPQARQALEAVLHPLVQNQQQKFIARHRGRKIVALDIPLLYETGAEMRVHFVAVVTAPAFVQRQRVMKRPKMTAARLNSILALQIPDRYKRDMADCVIPTGLGRAFTTQRLQKMLRNIKRGRR
jgi:dephospho-CoA kinase